jgi:hypothetical protein
VALPVIELLDGVIDGNNKLFLTSANYITGSVRVFRNGALLEASLVDGWTELGGKRVLLKEAPKDTDIMQAYYLRIYA